MTMMMTMKNCGDGQPTGATLSSCHRVHGGKAGTMAMDAVSGNDQSTDDILMAMMKAITWLKMMKATIAEVASIVEKQPQAATLRGNVTTMTTARATQYKGLNKN